MPSVKNKYNKLCLLIAVAVISFIIGSGFQKDIRADGKETYEGLKLFTDVIEIVEKNYVDSVDTKKLIQKAIQGMVGSLDPHSSFLPPEAFEELQIGTKGEFGGIGIVITMQNGILTVISPIEGTPAYIAGIKAGDLIVKVDGESTQDMMLWEAVKKMRGKKGTPVVITVMRKDAPEPIDYKLVRDIIPIESVRAATLRPGYGYLRITNFQDNTADDLRDNLVKLESQDIPLKGLVLDLRDNPGGLLPQSIMVSDAFLEDGIIVSMRGRTQEQKVYKAKPGKKKRNYPIVLLINGGSASASEIVAGALQDNKRALVLGTTSFGKGSVQTVNALRDGYGLKFTIARYYTPSGSSIQAKGIEPDITLKFKVLNEEADDGTNRRMRKEKDLKNHLNAEPDKKNGEKTEQKEKNKDEKGSKTLETGYRHGPIKLESLMKDNQVMRALEILIGYDILKDLHA